MPSVQPFTIRQLTCGDGAAMEALMTLFGQAFDEVEKYTGARPPRSYFEALLARAEFIAFAALVDGTVVGGITAFEFPRHERELTEIVICELAVAPDYRRSGIATALMAEMKKTAIARGADGLVVDTEADNEPAMAFYSTLGAAEQVVVFDIKLD